MLKPHALQAAARTVAEKIMPLESSLDESFAQTADLLAYLPKARLSAGLPMETGHAAIVQLVASLQSITDARGAIIAAHAALANTRNDLRLPETGFGSLAGCPSSASLRVVRENAA